MRHVKVKELSALLGIGIMVGACVDTGVDGDETLDVTTDLEQGSPEQTSAYRPEFRSVRFDGILYSGAQFGQRFGNQELHWIVTQESLEQGIPMAFSSEEKRNAVLGVPKGNDSVRRPVDMGGSLATYANLYEHTYGGGRALPISGNAYNLVEQSFNDKASSVRTYGRAIVMYQHSNMSGCSFGIDWGLYVANLTQWGFCGGGSWNDKVSSVRVR